MNLGLPKKPVKFLGSSREDMRGLPTEVRQEMGAELLRVQLGAMPTDFKPMPDVGKGVYEIRVRYKGAWRLLYVARFDVAIYVLHVFQKRTQKTSKEDLELAQRRYRSLGGSI